MKYSVLVDAYDRLEKNSGKIAKADIVSELLKEIDSGLIPNVVLLLNGLVFPIYHPQEIGVAQQLIIKTIAKTHGVSESEVVKKFKSSGDLGNAAEIISKSGRNVLISKKELTVEKIIHNLQSLADQTGSGSQDKKICLISELLSQASPSEAKYIVKTILGQLRVGVAEGIIRDAIAKTFSVDPENVDHAWNILSDFGEVASIAKEKGDKGLKSIKPELGKPIQVMLAEKAESIEEAVKELGESASEFKFDGARCQIHKKGDKFWLYTRRLEDITPQFPDLVDLAKRAIKAKDCIIEGEILAVDPKSGRPLPFQRLSQRILRKYEIGKIIESIPIQFNAFDIVYVDGKALFEKSLEERRKILDRSVKSIPDKFVLAEELVSDDPKQIEKFYRKALSAGQEGLMIKNLKSAYVFGRRVGGWYKIKPTMENLDLVIIGATWGEGKRARWLTSYALGCRDSSGEFLPCGMISTGLTEEEYEKMTKTLKPLIVKELGRTVEIKPKIVIEVGYQEIQKSVNYKAGYALRFPRFIRDRTADKSPSEADTLERLEALYKSHGKVG